MKKKQPNPFKQPRKFLLSTTPLFFGFYIFFKSVLSVLLGILVYNFGVDFVNGAKHLESVFFYWLSLVVVGIDLYAWVVLPFKEWLKKNKKADQFIVLNIALVFLISFVAMLGLTQALKETESHTKSCSKNIAYYDYC